MSQPKILRLLKAAIVRTILTKSLETTDEYVKDKGASVMCLPKLMRCAGGKEIEKGLYGRQRDH